MTTLASAVSIGDNQLIIDAPMTVGQIPGWVKIDSELLYAGGQHFRTGTTLVLSAPATAVHSSGATVTYAGRPYDAAFLTATAGEGAGGAIAVDNTVDPPAEVTTLIAPGADVSTPGEASTLPTGMTYDADDAMLQIDGTALVGIRWTQEGGPPTIVLDNVGASLMGTTLLVATNDGNTYAMQVNVGATDLYVDPMAIRFMAQAGTPVYFGISAAGALTMGGLPTADPELAGQLYTDGVPSGGVPKALMVSGGPA